MRHNSCACATLIAHRNAAALTLLAAHMPPSLPLLPQTRRLSKFPDYMREKCECFQERPPRHAVTREQTRQKLPDLQLPAEVGGCKQLLPGWGGANNYCRDGVEKADAPEAAQPSAACRGG